MRKTIDITKPPTQEQLDMLNKAAALPIPADAEYPEFSAEELKQFNVSQTAAGIRAISRSSRCAYRPALWQRLNHSGRGTPPY